MSFSSIWKSAFVTSKPKFAFVVLLENGKAGTLTGAAPHMRSFFETLVNIDSPYIRGEYPTENRYATERKRNEEAAKESAAINAATVEVTDTPHEVIDPQNIEFVPVENVLPGNQIEPTPTTSVEVGA